MFREINNSGFPSKRINLSPFTKDFRGGEQLNESFVISYRPTLVGHTIQFIFGFMKIYINHPDTTIFLPVKWRFEIPSRLGGVR